jgi:HAE1 family hydrophobic/amphiphilic exporter-1
MNKPNHKPLHGGGFNVSAWCIDHPWVVLSFYAAVVALGLIAIFGGLMPRRMMPYVESPMVGIVTMIPGLSAQETETYISKPIEERMTDIRGARYIRSTSQDGLSIVSLEFPYGADLRRATADVQALMNAVQADLPQTGANLKPSWVLPIDPLNLPVLSLSVTGDADTGWTPPAVRQFVENEGVRAIKQVGDVQAVTVYGGRKRQLHVEVDRDRLAAYGYSILDVRDAIDKHSTARPAGVLTSGPNETILRVADIAQDAQTVAGYPLGARNGKVVYLKDVATVTDTTREQRSGFHFVDGERKVIEGVDNDAVEMAVIQNPAAGSGPVIEAVRKQVAQLEQDHPGLHFHVAYDNAHFVNILFRNTGEELAVAVVLCGLAVLFFLGSGRGTVISLITIPVSMAMAILLMVPFGFSLNSSTLIGLLVSIGRLVDDSLIDIHAVGRHLAMGKAPKEATIDGITEVRLAVAASTIMLVLALSPLLFCGGITQIMFVGLVYPIIFGLIASFFVSLTLTAVLAAFLLRPHETEGADRSWFDRRVLAPVQARLERMDSGYQRLLRVLLRHKFTVVAAAVATIIVGFGFYHFIGSEMMPLADVGQAYGLLEMRPGASYAETAAATMALERILLKHPEIRRVSTEIGEETGGTYFTGYAMNQINTASMMLTLSDKDERLRDVWQVIDAVQREALATIPNIRRLQIKEMGSDVMASSLAPVTILVTGQDLNILSQLAEQVADVARRTPGALQVATSWAMEKPSYRLAVDSRRAAEVGLTPADVADQAYYAMGGALANEFYRLPNVRQDTINIRYRAGQRRSVYDLLQMPITGANGVQVPLKTLATVTPQLVPTVIEHDGLRRSVSVLAYYRKDGPPSMDLAMSIITKASAELNFPPGYSLEMRGDMTQMMDSFARLLRGLEVAILLIFLVLIAQFGGLLSPLQMVLSIPMELSGVFLGLYLAHQSFSTVSIMAVIVLTGMDITTAILLIDQTQRRRAEGRLPRDAAIAVASRDRLRPILMTSLITIITMLPVALAPKTGIDAYRPLGTVIVAGLTVGTLLSLLVIPVMHAIVDDLNQGAARLWRRIRGHKAVTDTAMVLLLTGLLAAGAAHAAPPNGPTSDAATLLPDLPTVSQPLSLHDAVAISLQHSPAIRQAAADVQAAEATIGSAAAAQRLTVSTTTYATLGDSANILTSAPGVTPQNALTVIPRPFADQNVMLMAPLYNGGRLSADRAAARNQVEAASHSAGAARLLVEQAVTEAYARALLAQALVEAAQARLTAEEEQVRITAEKVKAGRLAPVDLLREQAERADARQAALEDQSTGAVAMAELKMALGISQASQITLSDTLDGLIGAINSGLPATQEDAVHGADTNRPELAAALRQVEAMQFSVSATQAAYAPQVYAVAMADVAVGRDVTGGGRTGYTVGLTASLPLADGGQRRADTDAARARHARAVADAQRVRLTVEQEAQSAWLIFQTAGEKVKTADAGLVAAQQGYDLADLRYNAGKSVTAERLDALAALTRARGTLAQAKADQIAEAARLRAAIGGIGGVVLSAPERSDKP